MALVTTAITKLLDQKVGGRELEVDFVSLLQCFCVGRYELAPSKAKISPWAESEALRLFVKFFKLRLRNMWHLIEHFFDQNILMKAFLGLGWLSVLIMVFSFVQTV